jgi:transcriptional regulator with XRE-family HTH domain
LNVADFKGIRAGWYFAEGQPVDICLAIKQRLEKLGLEQRDLAVAAEVTESYISQLLTRKKSRPAPGRTDIYDKMGKFLKLPSGKLANLAEHQRKEELKRNLGDPPKPLFKQVRELILRKCAPAKGKQIRVIFEKQPFVAHVQRVDGSLALTGDEFRRFQYAVEHAEFLLVRTWSTT